MRSLALLTAEAQSLQRGSLDLYWGHRALFSGASGANPTMAEDKTRKQHTGHILPVWPWLLTREYSLPSFCYENVRRGKKKRFGTTEKMAPKHVSASMQRPHASFPFH